MTDYSYLFDSEKIYTENLISFYSLLQKKDIYNYIRPEITDNDFFLYLIYPNHTAVRSLLQRDELIRFKFIDFFSNNTNLIEQRERKIHELLLKHDVTYLNSVLNFVKKELDVNKLNNLKPLIEDMTANRDVYLQYLLAQTWSFEPMQFVNLEHLTIRLMLLYYFNRFLIKEKSFELKIDSPDYTEFLKLLIKYQQFYFINGDFTNINFRPVNLETSFFSRPARQTTNQMTSTQRTIVHFFNYLSSPHLVDQNVIAWFFIFFSSFIPLDYHNDLLYIILGFKKNTIGLVTRILSSFGKDYNQITEDEKNDIAERIESDYVFRQNERVVNKEDIKDYMNNIILLQNYNRNIDVEYQLLTNINLANTTVQNLFFILSSDPLKESWPGVMSKIRKIEKKFDDIGYEIHFLMQIFNSVQVTDFSQKSFGIFISGRYRDISLPSIITRAEEFENAPRVDVDVFDQDILFYNLLLFLNNFEIVLFNIETSLFDAIDNYDTDINTIKKIFHSIFPLKDFYDGYKRFK